MASKKKSESTRSKAESSRPSADGASAQLARRPDASARPLDKSPHAVDPGAIKLHSPIGPLMWLFIPLVLTVAIALLKK